MRTHRPCPSGPIGRTQALIEAGLLVPGKTSVAGASAGSLVAACLASGLGPKVMLDNMERVAAVGAGLNGWVRG
jgi:hypothetical protein